MLRKGRQDIQVTQNRGCLLRCSPVLLGASTHHLPPSPDTTRPQKKNEVDGKDYYFVSTEEMTRDISANEFLEFGSYQGNMFGTKFETVHKIHQQDKVAILDIEPQVVSRGRGGQDGGCHRLSYLCAGCNCPYLPCCTAHLPFPKEKPRECWSAISIPKTQEQ